VQVLSRALTLATDGVIELEHVAPALAEARRPEPVAAGAGSASDEALRGQLVQQLEKHQGNVAAVAREMAKAPMQVYRWMRRFGLDPKTYR
jgi:transcriptional regulator of acetoin/glycerol metabolism